MSDRMNSMLWCPYYCVDKVDGRLADMEVGWSLRGFLVLNVLVALNLSPSIHKDLNLLQRCEVALSGYILCDLMRMLADARCEKQGLPKNSFFLAPQTCSNMQAVALGTVSICVSKPPWWTPWKYGQARLSEISIEQFFAHIRRQSQTSQHTARSFWTASARHSYVMGEELRKSMKKAPCFANSSCGELSVCWAC